MSAVDESTMKLGLLLESAHAHQTLAETTLEKLRAHVGELEGIARDEIRSTLIEELRSLAEDGRRAAEHLRRLGRVANLRVALWGLGTAVLSCTPPFAAAWWLLPSRAEIEALTARRDALAENVARLTQQGGAIELRRCGTSRRLCVRVDRKAPAYGAGSDYLVVRGY